MFGAADRLQAAGFRQGAGNFRGQWAERHTLNIPGPLYVGDDDSCGTGPYAAPDHVILLPSWINSRLPQPQPGEWMICGEFIYRQPATERELDLLVRASEINVCDVYAFDGDQHWSPESVSA